MRIALLDDYQDVARSSADWDSLPGCEVVAFHDHLEDEVALAERLRGFDVVVGVRQRVVFTRSLLERIPHVRLLMSGGGGGANLDLQAATDLGITVCMLRGVNTATAEHAWALLLALARQVPQEEPGVVEQVRGGCDPIGGLRPAGGLAKRCALPRKQSDGRARRGAGSPVEIRPGTSRWDATSAKAHSRRMASGPRAPKTEIARARKP